MFRDVTPREAMLAALKPTLNAYLRPLGFKGSFPHFRQIGEAQIRLITFQFFSSGGSFVVEIAECGPDGITDRYGHVRRPPGKATAHDVFAPRPRLGADHFPHGDNWFEFGQPNYEAGSDRVFPDGRYQAIADEVVRLLDTQAAQFWGAQLEERRAGREPSRY